MMNRTAKLLETEMFRDQTTLVEVLDNMDEMVFGELVKRKSAPLADVMRAGILKGGVDWLNTGKPTGEYGFASTAEEVMIRVPQSSLDIV